VARLTEGVDGVRLTAETVLDDGVEDRLTGSSGWDWFLATVEGKRRDKVTDRHHGERLTALVPIVPDPAPAPKPCKPVIDWDRDDDRHGDRRDGHGNHQGKRHDDRCPERDDSRERHDEGRPHNTRADRRGDHDDRGHRGDGDRGRHGGRDDRDQHDHRGDGERDRHEQRAGHDRRADKQGGRGGWLKDFVLDLGGHDPNKGICLTLDKPAPIPPTSRAARHARS
jgi:hypothetical protein